MITRASKLHPTIQRVLDIWPLLAAGALMAWTLVVNAFGASAELRSDTSDIATLKKRVDKLEAVIPDIREDLATIKQQGADNGVRLNRIENRLDEERKSR